jgi:hypothetical protein
MILMRTKIRVINLYFTLLNYSFVRGPVIWEDGYELWLDKCFPKGGCEKSLIVMLPWLLSLAR